jgi:hypothetical protein
MGIRGVVHDEVDDDAKATVVGGVKENPTTYGRTPTRPTPMLASSSAIPRTRIGPGIPSVSSSTLGLNEVRDGVESESVNTQVHPEADGVEHFLHNSRLFKVEIGLVMEESVRRPVPH